MFILVGFGRNLDRLAALCGNEIKIQLSLIPLQIRLAQLVGYKLSIGRNGRRADTFHRCKIGFGHRPRVAWTGDSGGECQGGKRACEEFFHRQIANLPSTAAQENYEGGVPSSCILCN